MKSNRKLIFFLTVLSIVFGLNTAFAANEDDRFRFVDVPDSIQPFDDFSFTLEALDAAGEVDDTYVGEVHFFTDTDVNAIFPEDYKFQLSDAGVKEFSGFSFFTEEGLHEFMVVDVSDDLLEGSSTVTVSSDGGGSDSVGTLTVLSPTSGATSSSVISFSGSTDAGLEVRIFDDGEILDSVDADGEGNFSYQSPVLPDGLHNFILETDYAESSNIAVNINTQGIEVSSVSFNPEDFSGGATTTITINFGQEVDSVAVVVDGVQTDLVKSDTLGRAYSGSITLPSEAGAYPLNVVANSLTISGVGTVNVTDPFSLDGSQGSSEITFFVPSQVQNVQVSGTDRRINLSWNPATDNTGIHHYAIFYGTAQNSLTSRVDTNDSNTSWYVPNLENGQTYYFQVYGVDTEGNIGDQGSAVVAAIPSIDGSTTLHGANNGQVQVDQTSETGSGDILFLIFSSLMVSYFIRYKVRRMGG
jgi:hypothetical protein